MKYFCTLLMCITAPLFASQPIPCSLQKVEPGLFLLYFDITGEKSGRSKSVVIECSSYLVLIDLPISLDGAGAKHLIDHTEDAENVLTVLQTSFPQKPLKYVLSTHWHPHSISSVIPFITRGITLVTTRLNFKRISEFVDSTTAMTHRDCIRYVEGDSLNIGEGTDRIIAYRFAKTDYPNVPTEDFLYFHVARHNLLHTSCMYPRIKGITVAGKEFVYPRSEDLHRFLIAHNLKPSSFTLTSTSFDSDNGLIPYSFFEEGINNGITETMIMRDYLQIDGQSVDATDSLVKVIITNKIPSFILNSAVYSALRNNELKKALLLAKLQAVLSPSNPNSWDTYGEVYYFMGEKELATAFGKQAKKIDPKFASGGEETWKEDLEKYKLQWTR